MDYQVTYAPRALWRLQQIVHRIAQQDRAAATRVGLRLIEQTELLALFPELGAPYAKRPGVRRLACKPYLIYYRIDYSQHRVQIMEFWHAAQQDPKL